MTVALIWAQDRNGAVGRDNTIPWRVPEDQKRFRELTRGHRVVMGRRTWESLPVRFRPLPDRRNIVLTRDVRWSAPGAEVAHDLSAALRIDPQDTVIVMGGSQIYAAALPFADHLWITDIDTVVADADAHAPDLDDEWDCSIGEWATSTTGMRYRYRDLTRRR
ncbi:dihydrofolate reductase [Williamsia sp. CHRR-6]|uniref:dihydrofolate reductase n=1 Tax=Williamsia sp. CHRR-6 TaxID=2835871 RepID=UPI001BDB0F77|nr:dihydrofolate reductase [Williamsia sp. CHRR-6]MBT0567878.1 dihydrofolate reductase [Williamsia sp. CHRR-6]